MAMQVWSISCENFAIVLGIIALLAHQYICFGKLVQLLVRSILTLYVVVLELCDRGIARTFTCGA